MKIWELMETPTLNSRSIFNKSWWKALQEMGRPLIIITSIGMFNQRKMELNSLEQTLSKSLKLIPACIALIFQQCSQTRVPFYWTNIKLFLHLNHKLAAGFHLWTNHSIRIKNLKKLTRINRKIIIMGIFISAQATENIMMTKKQRLNNKFFQKCTISAHSQIMEWLFAHLCIKLSTKNKLQELCV